MSDLILTGQEQRDLQIAASMRGTLFCQNCRKKKLNVCQDCGGCQASCRRGIDIGLRLNSLIAEGLYRG